MIHVTDLLFAYTGREPVLNGLTFSIQPDTHVALMGPGGSGKSTLALLLKGLLNPLSGSITVDGIHGRDDDSRLEIMKRVGLVFQNPDNTIVATTVEREIAFGLENLGVPHDDMVSRVDEALERLNLGHYRFTNPSNLSGGEKQRCALAAVLAMHPDYLILDEPTSLLDPASRNSLLEYIHETALSGTTIIHITQYIEEARHADRVIVLGSSGIEEDGSPDEVLSETNRFRSCSFPSLGQKHSDTMQDGKSTVVSAHLRNSKPDNSILINLENITHSYNRGTPFEHKALDNVSLSVFAGTSTALIGPTGSGKTTLLEIIAGVTDVTEGTKHIKDNPLCAMAFQFPEDQMYGETVASYVSFGPQNIGIVEPELSRLVDSTLDAVGLESERYRDRDPLFLSGGEKRRTALAGVLAMKPDILVLDEPTAGLDRTGMDHVLAFLRGYIENGGTLIFSTHDFEAAWRLADFTVVLDDGRIETSCAFDKVFEESAWMRRIMKYEG